MAKRKPPSKQGKVRGQTGQAKFLTQIARQTARLWCRHHLTYDQTKHVVERTRGELHLERRDSAAEAWTGSTPLKSNG
jgi:integrase/recombinase XerD